MLPTPLFPSKSHALCVTGTEINKNENSLLLNKMYYQVEYILSYLLKTELKIDLLELDGNLRKSKTK